MSHKKHKKVVRPAPSFVKQGKPIINIPHRYIRLIATLTVFYHLSTLAYNAEMITIAIRIKNHIGDYLNIILEGGYTMVIVLFISSLIGIALNIFITVVLLKVFKHMGTMFYWLLFASMLITVLFMISIFCLIIYIIIYAFHMNPDGIDNFYVLMENYSTNSLVKERIDTMQIELQCCGVKNYSDWYRYEWLDDNFIKDNEYGAKPVGDVPFSCCNILSMSPCIHHGIESGGMGYNYDIMVNFSLNIDGCWAAIESRKTKSGLTVAGYLGLQLFIVLVGFIPLRFIQTASNERTGFDKEDHVYVAWLWGFYRKDEHKKGDTPPPDYDE